MTLLLDGAFSSDEYKAVKEEIEVNLSKLRAAMEDDAADQQAEPDPAAFRQKVVDVLEVLKAADVDEGTKNELLRGIIEKIEYHKPAGRFDIYFTP